MIDMFLKMGEVTGTPLIGSVAWNTRLNQVLLVIALLCVPEMLLVKPLWHLFKHAEHSPRLRQSKASYHEFEDEEEGHSINDDLQFEREAPGTENRMREEEAKSDN